jgi:hypothetical protein
MYGNKIGIRSVGPGHDSLDRVVIPRRLTDRQEQHNNLIHALNDAVEVEFVTEHELP